MSDPCLTARQALFVAAGQAEDAAQRGSTGEHLRACAACRAWLATFAVEGARAAADDGFTATTLLRIDLARLKTDAALPDPASAGLIPDIDPGPAFTARVLAATSGAHPRGVAATWRRTWDALVRRPRFALEAAYVATLVLMLVSGNRLAAIGETAARAEPLVQHLEAPAKSIGAGLRALEHRVAASIEAWLTDLADAADAAAGWLRRHVGEPADGLVRSLDQTDAERSTDHE